MTTDRQALYVLKNKVRSAQLPHDTDKMLHERVPRVIKSTVTDQRESLAWSSAHNNINATTANSSCEPDLRAGDVCHVFAQHGTLRKVKGVHSGVHRIDLDGGYDVEACLFEAKTHASGSGK